MTFPTHRAFAIGWVLLGNMVLYRMGMTEVNYFLALIIMLHVGKYGALFPDIDHHWQNVKEKTVPNWIINKIIHMTGGKHRSWQTHSIDIVAVVTILSFIIPDRLYVMEKISKVNMEVLSIIMIGFSLGWMSHIFSDMLTSAGVRLFCWNKFKVALVPKQLFGVRFNTGNEWEHFVCNISKGFNVVIAVVAICYPILMSEFGDKIIKIIYNILS